MRPVVWFVVGATASGKSAVAARLARRLAGTVVNADSRQVYRGMVVGAAAPGLEEQELAPHVGYHWHDPCAVVSLGEWLAHTAGLLREVLDAGRTPVVVGGSGQYVTALVQGWTPPAVPPDPAMRAELEERARRDGRDVLWRELRERDPDAAARIDPRNVRRLVRALEVIASTGLPFSEQRRRVEPWFAPIVLGIDVPRSELYRRIDARAAAMFAGGLLEEARTLRALDPPQGAPPRAAIGYREALDYLEGRCGLEDAIRRACLATHRLARVQDNWFRRHGLPVRWVAGSGDPDAVAEVALRLGRDAAADRLAGRIAGPA